MTMTASEMGKKGGRNKALKMSKEERVAHAKKMLKARWENRKK